LQQAANQGAAQMQTSLDAMRAGLGDKINTGLANNMQAQIDKIKTDAVAISNPATAQTAALALAKTEPAAVEKNIKKLLPLAVEYNSKNYSTNGTTIKMQPGELGGLIQNSGDIPLNCGFYLKNMVEGEPISWKLQTSSGTDIALEAPLRISASVTDAYLGIKWPDGQTSLKLSVVSGDRSLNFTLQKPEWFVKDLVVSETRRIQKYDITNGKITQGKTNTRTAKAGETLYLVHDNNLFTTDRKPVYKFTSNLDDALLKKYITHHNYSSGTSYTFENSSGPTSHKLPMTYYDVPGVFGVNINSLGYDKTVKVQLVPFDKSEDEGIISSELLTKVKKLRDAIKDINKIKDKVDAAMGEKAGLKKDGEKGLAVVINGQRYNEEDPDSRNYFGIKEYELKLVGSFEYTFSYGPTKLIPNALKDYVNIAIYAKPSLDFELIRNAKYRSLNSTGPELYYKPDSYDKFQVVGGVAIGAIAKVNASHAFKFELNASGKAEIEGSRSMGRDNVRYIVIAKPLVLNFSAMVEIATIPILQYNYIKNLTNEIIIHDTNN
jgi:hypothetical protein